MVLLLLPVVMVIKLLIIIAFMLAARVLEFELDAKNLNAQTAHTDRMHHVQFRAMYGMAKGTARVMDV